MYRRCGFRYEKKLHALGVVRIAGIDEAGRGALAGPVVAREIPASKIKGLETTPARTAPGNLRRAGVARRYYLEHRRGRLLRD